MAYIVVERTYTDGFYVHVEGLQGGYTYDDREVRWYANGTLNGSADEILDHSDKEGGYYTYTGLKSGRTYTLTARIYGRVLANAAYGYVTVKYDSDGEEVEVTTDKPSVELWNWNRSNGEATASQTRAALNALVNREATTNFSYHVWNDLCNKVSELRQAAGESAWDSYRYGDLSDTLMTSRSKILTANRFNALRNNLNAVRNCGVAVVSRGDIVDANAFTNITVTINEAIDRL